MTFFKGSFKHGKYHGFSTFIDKNKTKYDGMFMYGLKNGNGILQGNGVFYTGFF